mmetsp:Transcript_18857/g.49724  ORF Transcript_18857/g.49724 Transcript_18857/m.49724 type:complete len:297 (-) Transcript_18857:10-900(-)
MASPSTSASRSPSPSASASAPACTGGSGGGAAASAELHKAVAATSALGIRLLRCGGATAGEEDHDAVGDGGLMASGLERCAAEVLDQRLAEVLPELLLSVLGVGSVARRSGVPLVEGGGAEGLGEEMRSRAEAFEAWHLDGSLLALALCGRSAGSGGANDGGGGGGSGGVVAGVAESLVAMAEEVVVAEACSRRQLLTERSLRFWLARLFRPGVLARSELPHRLCAELQRLESESPIMDASAGSALRDCAFLAEEERRASAEHGHRQQQQPTTAQHGGARGARHGERLAPWCDASS